MMQTVKDSILKRIDKEIEEKNKEITHVRLTGRGATLSTLNGQVDGLNKAREIVRLDAPDKDRLDVLIELIANSLDRKPQPVQIQNFELYFQVSAAIATAPKRYIIRLLQALHYFRNKLN